MSGRRSGRRLTGTLVTLWTLVIAAGTASADITFDDRAQAGFGVDAEGAADLDADDTVRPLREGWEIFGQTQEGMRIWERLDGIEDLEITIETVDPTELGSGDTQGKVYGSARVTERDGDGKPTKIVIKIRDLSTGGSYNLADTLYHELRHAEIWVDNPGENAHDEHDEVDGYEDEIYKSLRSELIGLEFGTETDDDDSSSKPETPIYDELFGDESSGLRTEVIKALGNTLEDMVDLGGPGITPTFTDGSFDILDVLVASVVELPDDEFLETIKQATADIDSGSIIDPLVDPTGDLVALGIEFAGEPFLDSEVRRAISVNIETDGETGNDALATPPFNPAQGTDLQYRIEYEPLTGEWTFRTVRLGPGGVPFEMFPSRAGGFVDGNTVIFLLPGYEIGGDGDGFRIAAESGTSVDVLGGDPTGPLLPLSDLGLPAEPQDPRQQIEIDSVSVVTDATRDAWLLMHPMNPWLPGAPFGDITFSMAVFGGIEVDGMTYGGAWSLHDGVTSSQGFVGDDLVPVEWFTTPLGDVAMKVPGPSPTGGLSIDVIPTDMPAVFGFGQIRPEDGGDLIVGEGVDAMLGDVTIQDQRLPILWWNALAVDEQPTVQIAAGTSGAALPSRLLYTATKTADLTAVPDFLSVPPVGTELPWSIDVTESCSGGTCTHSSVVRPLNPSLLFGDPPAATWIVDGPQWSLDAVWPTTQSSFDDGTVCVIENRWTYELTITTAGQVEGTWVQASKLDLGASTGDLEKCGAAWAFADEWSVVSS